jgi:uncharacterized protein
MLQPTAVMSPVKQSERIALLDSLRGIAILGILLVNIRGFGLPYPAIIDPAVNSDTTGKNFYAWFINEWLIDGSFRALLSMLFGAGMLLFLDRGGTQKIKGPELFFRRQFWLFLFGLVNIYLFLWFWDILYMYAVCGMILFAFRKLPVTKLFVAAAICLLMTDILDTVELYSQKVIIHKGETILQAGTGNTPDQSEAVEEYNLLMKKISLVSKQKQAEEAKENTTGKLASLYDLHRQKSVDIQTSGFFTFYFWDILLFMFLGIAFYKLGILTGKASARFYWILTLSAFGIGLLLSWFRLKPILANNFDEYQVIKNTAVRFYETARSFRSLGFLGLIMLLYKSGVFGRFFRLLQPVGQMALSNYLIQSIVCGLFFYGIGFGMFGKLDRTELYYVVLIVWLLQIIFSHVWLRYFLYGPFEWAWRSLTYWKKQPFRK